MCPYHGHDDLIHILPVSEAYEDIDVGEIFFKSIGYAILIIDHIGTDGRHAEPDFQVHLLCEFPDSDDVVIISDCELVAVEENCICLEGTLLDEGLE